MIYFSSDHHFGHHNIIKYCNRPFQNTDHMDEQLIALWNETVSPSDTVYYLGDFSLSKEPVRAISKRLNGKKILVAGNHDRCFRKRSQTKTKDDELYLENGWSEIHRELVLQIGGIDVKLNHLPYDEPGADHYTEHRYPAERPERTTPWLLCGHVHNLWKTHNDMINVGCDVWNYKPVSENEILAILKG